MIPNTFSSITEHHAKTFENRVSGDVTRHVLARTICDINLFRKNVSKHFLYSSLISTHFVLLLRYYTHIFLGTQSGRSQTTQILKKNFQQNIERSVHIFLCLTGETCSRNMFLLITSQTVRTSSGGLTFFLGFIYFLTF